MAERIPLPARGEQSTGLRLASLFLAEQRSGRMKAVLNWYCWLIRGGKMQSTYPLLECCIMVVPLPSKQTVPVRFWSSAPRSCRTAWSVRHTVTVEVVGSSPIRIALSPWSSGLGLHPFTVATRVRIPLEIRLLNSGVEYPPCKRVVVGSNPTGGSSGIINMEEIC